MKTNKGCSILNSKINTQAYDIPQVEIPGALKLHFRLGVVGSSGSGKTTSVVNYLKQTGYIRPDIFTNIVLISPSGTSNRVTHLRAEPKWAGIASIEYENFSKPVLAEIERMQLDRILTHKTYLSELELWNRFIKEGVEDLTDAELMFLESKDFKRPISPFGTEHYPTLLILMDDCCSSSTDKMLGDFCSRSRHYNASVIIMVQHYSQMGRALRKQLSSLMLFKTLDETLLKLLWQQQCAGDMKFQQFQAMFNSLEHRHNFVFCDWNSEKVGRYRINFDEYITL